MYAIKPSVQSVCAQ